MIVLQCNDLYFKWLILFLNSYVAMKHEFPVFVSLFNGTQDMKEQCLAISPLVKVELDVNNDYGIPFDRCSLREGLTSRKVYVLADVVDRFDLDWVLMLDVDMLCRKNIAFIINEFLESSVDVAVVRNIKVNQNEQWRYYSASCNFFNKSAFHAIYYWEYLIKLRDPLLDFSSFHFGWDQITLYVVIQQYANTFNIQYLDRFKYIDDSFSSDAYFWTWGTVNENFKDVIFNFFSDHQHGERLDSVGMKNYMDAFFELGCFREAYSFAHQLVMVDSTNLEALFVLGVVYCKELKNYDAARRIFSGLINAQFRVDDCQQYLVSME